MTVTTVGPMPPHGIIDGFLPDAERRALLDWAMSHRAAFKPAKVFAGEGGRHEHEDPRLRVALKLYGIGPFDALVRERLLANLPQILAFAGYNGPDPRSIEFELNAYGDGAHFGPHIDIPVGAGRRTVGEEDGEDRMVSAVYYFFNEPKGFSGGALRLYRFGANPPNCEVSDSISFEPVQNRLVIFPSWARHAVERVTCKSGRFADHRFALNCWFCRNLAD